MGLDMNLYRKNLVYDKNEMIMDKIEGKDTEYEEVAYWRKFYCLHDWFARNLENGVDNCEYELVTEEQLKLLLNVIEIVLNNHELADEYLANDEANFVYDNYYFEELEGKHSKYLHHSQACSVLPKLLIKSFFIHIGKITIIRQLDY